MRIWCLNCKNIFRTRRRKLNNLKCPHCGEDIINVFSMRPLAYIIMEDVKLKYAR